MDNVNNILAHGLITLGYKDKTFYGGAGNNYFSEGVTYGVDGSYKSDKLIMYSIDGSKTALNGNLSISISGVMNFITEEERTELQNIFLNFKVNCGL